MTTNTYKVELTQNGTRLNDATVCVSFLGNGVRRVEGWYSLDATAPTDADAIREYFGRESLTVVSIREIPPAFRLNKHTGQPA